MARKLRIALISTATVVGIVVAGLWSAWFAVQQVRPFYHQALELDQQVLEDARRELESRATALYSDTREAGKWHALFTAEQINGWLAIQLAENGAAKLPPTISQPRVAISPDVLTLGFRTTHGGIETVISVDAAAFLTEEGAVAVRLVNVRAGALPLPVMQVAEQIAAGCRELGLPVRWTQQDGQPIAIVEISNDESSDKRRLYLDVIELNEGELYVAGHTEVGDPGPKLAEDADDRVGARGRRAADPADSIELTGYELRLTRSDDGSALEISRRSEETGAEKSEQPDRSAARTKRQLDR